jgi:CHAT domain-containing protein/tetratricopeptide (TPR) repeat protein
MEGPMKTYLLIPLLALVPVAAGGQEAPRVTKEGKEAFEKLILAALDDGALKVAKDPEGNEVPVANEGKLRKTLAAHPKLLTPALRDAIVANWFRIEPRQKPVYLAFLRAYCQEKKDERGLAFAALFTATAERERKLSAAVAPYREAVRLFGAINEPGWQAVCLNDIGLTCHNLADYQRAIEALQKALPLWRKAHDGPHPGTANSLGNLGLAYHDVGDLDRALDCHQQALAMRRKLATGPDPDVAQSLYNLGAVYHSLGDYARALEHHEQALALLRKVYAKPHPETALALDNVGSTHAVLGELDKALGYLRKALAMRQKLSDKPNRDVAQSLQNVGTAYLDLGDHARALDYLQRALDMKQEVYDRPHPDVALTLNNLGAAFSDAGDYTGALDTHRKALALWRKVHPGPHPDNAVSLNNIATAYRHLGESPKALQALDDALKELCLTPAEGPLFEKVQAGQLRPLPISVQVLRNRGRTLERALPDFPTLAQLRECERCYALAALVLDRVRQESLVHETSKLHAGATETALAPLRVGICRRLHLRDGNPASLREAFQAAEQGRARVFLDALGRSRAGLLGGVSPELQAREADLRHRLRGCDLRLERAELNPAQAEMPPARLWEERRGIEADLREVAGEMAKRFPRYAALKSPQPCPIEEARACLGPDEVALHFVLGEEFSYVLLLEGKPAPGDRTGGLALYPLPGADAIADGVAAVTDRDTLALPARVRSLGAELYARLLAPLADRLRGKNLVIVPDGPLGYLPFELLVEGADGADGGRFLIETHRIRYAPSLTVLHLVRRWAGTRERQPDRPLWALGDPVYDAGDRRPADRPALAEASRDAGRELLWREGHDRGEGTFPRLVHSGAEVEAVRRALGAPQTSVVLGKEATEARVRQASASGDLGRARYVHFACHGVLGLDDGQPPALVLTLVGNSGERDEFGRLDGFLRLDEVTNLRLNADLVVLSACRSGQGKLWNGEGVASLARSFLHAGSRGVVCSLWSVDDRETAALMTALYGRLKDGQGAADALCETRRALIRAGKAPVYWAPFVLVGE